MASSRPTVLLVLLVVLSACSREVPTSPEPDPFSVRLLTSAPLSGRWERAAERGLGRIAAELGADVGRVRCAAADLSAAVRRNPEGRPADLVFCVGPGFGNAIFTEAAALPEVHFVLLPGRAVGENVAGIDFAVEGAAYLGGVMAAALAEGGKVGIIRGQGKPWLEDVEEGFSAGFRSRRHNGELLSASGGEAPWTLRREDVRVALYVADRRDPAVLAAAHDAGLPIIAVNPDLMVLAPDTVVAAISIDVAEAMFRVAREVREGSFHGGAYSFDLGSGVVDLELSTTHEAAQRPEVLELVDEARSEVTAGIIEVEQLGI